MLSPHLDEKSTTALYIQLYSYIKKEITDNNLRKNEKLPSKRNLAAHLGISVNTVSNAYEALMDEGYIYSKERSGYYVSAIDNLLISKYEKELKTSSMPFTKENVQPPASPQAATHRTFSNHRTTSSHNKITNVDTENFPLYTFKKVLTEVVTENSEIWLKERDFQGLYPLRSAISAYIYSARGVKTSPENIVVSSGIEYLMQILFYILPEKSVFGLENPGSPAIRDLCRSNKQKCLFLPLDKYGVRPQDAENCNIILITPSHQFPTGIVMPVQRRVELLNQAGKIQDRYIIEDDYDSEFKYYGKPVPALKSLDRSDSVIYIGNFSKSISPALRLSFMVLPDKLLKKYYDVMPFINCPVSSIIQLTTAKFIKEGYFERHLNRMKTIYRKKRRAATTLLEKYPHIKIIDKKAGLHLVAEVDFEETIIKDLRSRNIFVESLSSYYLDGKPDYDKPRILIGFGNISSTT